MRVQLHRALSKLGFCSRTDAKKLIFKGLVTVNGAIQRDMYTWVDIETDRIKVLAETTPDGIPADAFDPRPPGITIRAGTGKKVYVALHKPAGYVTTFRDERGRKTVYDLLPEELRHEWLFPVGRLDLDSEGLLFMTNDGPWASRLTDPSSHVSKTYRVLLDRLPPDDGLDLLLKGGMMLDGAPLLPASVERDKGRWFVVTLNEGKNRQIRRMFWQLKCKVKRLVRTGIGGVTIEGLEAGKWRALKPGEVGER
jgi:23S rRNA pseudouridine2605 synthase